MKKYIYLLFFIVIFLPNTSNSQDLTAEEIFEKVNDAIVVVYTYDFEGDKHAQGSGIILNDQGIVVTNYHIFAGCERIELKRKDNIVSNSGIIGVNIEKDVLIIKLDGNDYPNIPICESNECKVGQKIYAVGSPMGYENTMSEGIVSGLREIGETTKNSFIQITASASSGSSGGAVLNSKGELVGMVSMGYLFGEMNFAIPIKDILDANKGLLTDKKTLDALEYFYKGYNKFEIGKFEDAVTNYSKYIELSPREAKAFNYRGLAYWKLKKYNKAIKDFTKAMKIDPNFKPAYINRAEVYIKMEEYEKGTKDLGKLIKMDPENVNAYYSRGVCYSKDESYSKAIKDFSKVIKLDPEYVEAYVNRGICKFYDKDYSGAMDDWYRAIKLDPDLKPQLTHWIDQADYLRTIGY
jgi:S1-C subfamily serine protease